MVRIKLFFVSFLLAIAISGVQFWIAVHYSTAILWQVRLMHHLAAYLLGPGPILGYSNGQPMYEGTPVHIVAAFVGLGLGAILYWVIGYFVIRRWHN